MLKSILMVLMLSITSYAAMMQKSESYLDSKLNTHLFNLLINQKSVINGKNNYVKEFDKLFDNLISNSSFNKTKEEQKNLKKRLLSGPANTPKIYEDSLTHKLYFLYDACQAHQCDIINMLLLYDANNKRMCALINDHAGQELLGEPSKEEEEFIKFISFRKNHY